MILGPPDSGKSTLARLLANYAVRASSVPLLIDLDTSSSLLSLPGTLSASPINRIADPEEAIPSVPVALYYGLPSPLDRSKVYAKQLEAMSSIVSQKLESDADVRAAGCVIDTPSEFSTPAGRDLLIKALDAFKPTVLFVIGDDRLHSDLSKLKRCPVIKLVKSGGTVARDKGFRKMEHNERCREYFYGTEKNELLPYSTTLTFTDASIWRLGSGGQATERILWA